VRAVQWSPNRAAGQGRSGPARRRLCGDEGAALVEAAFVTPVFLLMLFGVVEFGSAYGDYLSLSNLVQTAARQESVQGNNIQADWLTIQSVKNANNALPISRVQQIVIFKASGPGTSVPVACKSASQNVGGTSTPGVGSCNRFTSSEWNSATGSSWTCASTAIASWCPSLRKVKVADPPDYLGVYIEARHPFITGLFGSALTLTDTTIIRLEPQRLG